MFGRNLSSLTWVIFCFFLLSCSFFFFSNVNLPKSMILQTGGSACSAITTTSSPSSRAFAMADGGSTTPSWPPSEPMSRTCWKRRMNSLMGEFFVGGTRGPPLKNARVISSLGLGSLDDRCSHSAEESRFSRKVKTSDGYARRRWRVPPDGTAGNRPIHHSQKLFNTLILEFPAVSDAQRNRVRRLLPLTHDEERRHLAELAVPDLGAQLFASEVARRAQP